MKPVKIFILWLLLPFTTCFAQSKRYNAIYSGTPWYDDRGNIVSAHGACIVKDGNNYYLFGERHADTSNVFTGFNCYSSADLYNWKFEAIALPLQDTGRLGPNTVGERPKVMKCSQTGEYIMFMHADNTGYKDQCVAYATAKIITGPYIFKGPLLFNGKPVKKWDMGTYQDDDGNGYLLTHGGDIYKLAANYQSVTGQIAKDFALGSESPVILKKDGVYFWLGSHLTSWERNDNFYYTATSLNGPWTYRGLFTPEGKLTWNSQTTFVLPVKGAKQTTYIYMGDRWSYPHQTSSATYVWQPMEVEGSTLSIPEYKQAWQIDQKTGDTSSVAIGERTIYADDKKQVNYKGKWEHQQDKRQMLTDAKGATFSVTFNGKQIGVIGMLRPDGGYAAFKLTDSKGKTVLSGLTDLYCKYETPQLSIMSPVMKKDVYTLTVTVAGEHGSWADKRKSNYGSTGNFVCIKKIIVN